MTKTAFVLYHLLPLSRAKYLPSKTRKSQQDNDKKEARGSKSVLQIEVFCSMELIKISFGQVRTTSHVFKQCLFSPRALQVGFDMPHQLNQHDVQTIFLPAVRSGTHIALNISFRRFQLATLLFNFIFSLFG